MTIDPKTIAADIMTMNARDITPSEVWAHIGQAYDTTDIDASIADEVTALIGKTGIDLIWPDGTTNTELDAARVDIERLRAALAEARAERDESVGQADHLDAELTKARAQVADLTNRLHRADADNASHAKAVTAWASQVEELKKRLAAVEPSTPQYLIWSHKQNAWWGPGGHGYRWQVIDAGRFTLDQANDHASTRTWPASQTTPPEVVIPTPPVDVLTNPERISGWIDEQIDKATAEKIAARAATEKAEVA